MVPPQLHPFKTEPGNGPMHEGRRQGDLLAKACLLIPTNERQSALFVCDPVTVAAELAVLCTANIFSPSPLAFCSTPDPVSFSLLSFPLLCALLFFNFCWDTSSRVPPSSFFFPSVSCSFAIMKFSIAAAVTATAGLAAASPLVTRVRAEDLKPSNLGGATFRVRIVENRDFNSIGKGPRALGRVYQKYGVEMSEGLLAALESIAEKMNVKTHFSKRDGNNTNTGAGKGETLLSGVPLGWYAC
jgi:hypothetical protein